MRNLLIICFLALLSFGCSDEEADTNFIIEVLDCEGDYYSGIKVGLYGTDDDRINQVNPLYITYTNKDGEAEFNDIEPITYYFHIEIRRDTSIWSNRFYSASRVSTILPIPEGQTTTHYALICNEDDKDYNDSIQ